MPLIGSLPPPIANIRYWPGPIPNIRYSSAFAIGAVQLPSAAGEVNPLTNAAPDQQSLPFSARYRTALAPYLLCTQKVDSHLQVTRINRRRLELRLVSLSWAIP